MTTNAVGLDIGSTGVRAIELSGQRKTMPVVIRSQEVALPAGAVVRGEILDGEVVSKALKKLWAQGGFKSKKVVLGVGNESVQVRELTVPKMPLKNIRESLTFHVIDTPSAPVAGSLLDFYPVSEVLGERGPMINGLFISAEKEGVTELVRVVERAGLLPIEIELTPFALNRVLVRRPEVMGTVALIDIGGSTTSVTISTNGEPVFVRMISAGGDDVTQALQEGLKIGREDAESRKRTLEFHRSERREWEDDELVAEATRCECPKCITSDESDFNPKQNGILKAVTEELLAGLVSTVNYFNNSRPETPVSQIILTGGGSNLAGLSSGLSQITRLPINAVDPFSTFTISQKKRSQVFRIDDAMTVALGLALRSTP
ncbi:MAG: type IV pilus assembly protein PilM [Actinomycetes bacterium]